MSAGSGAERQGAPAIVLIVAVAENGVIGKDGALPWRLASDLKRFRALTLGRPVVMGRKTYLAIGKPLDGRTNIVVTRDPDFKAAGTIVARSVEDALAAARADAQERGVDEIAIIGGADIYRQTMPLADRLEVTIVHARPVGDAFFAPIDPALWRELARREKPQGGRDSAPMAFVTYGKNRAG